VRNKSVATATDAAHHPAFRKADIATIYDLTDQHGPPVGSERFSGRLRRIVFGYTACPDACPTAITDVASVM
jgi:protein SCO1/2